MHYAFCKSLPRKSLKSRSEMFCEGCQSLVYSLSSQSWGKVEQESVFSVYPQHPHSSLIKVCVDVRKKMNKSSDDSHFIKNKIALHVGYKTIFLGTSDKYKSIKLKYIYLFVEVGIYQFSTC